LWLEDEFKASLDDVLASLPAEQTHALSAEGERLSSFEAMQLAFGDVLGEAAVGC
jgi:hypothetical protein